jgi:hypothetical protein
MVDVPDREEHDEEFKCGEKLERNRVQETSKDAAGLDDKKAHLAHVETDPLSATISN